MPMGNGWYLRAMPVWFARRGNYGVLLSQAKALSAASRLRGDSAGMDLAQRQAEWIVGRNPFVQSTMYGEGYDWSQQYSVSSGDFVGSLPVGMQSSGDSDLPYWSSANMYVFKEVWVHSTGRWLWLMEDLLDRPPAVRPLAFTVGATREPNGDVTVHLTATGGGTHRYTLRTDNLRGETVSRTIRVPAGGPASVRWRVRPVDAKAQWTVVVIEDGNAARRRELSGP
jgi:hypothetical protein